MADNALPDDSTDASGASPFDELGSALKFDAPNDHGAPRTAAKKAPVARPAGAAPPPPPPPTQGASKPMTAFQKATTANQPDMSLGSAIQKAGQNFLPSLGSNVGSMINAAVHPVETVESIGHIIQGGGSQLAGALGAQQDPKQKAKEEQIINQLENHYKDAYGSWSGFKNYLANDPASLLTDAATVVSGGAGAIGKGLKFASGAAEAANFGKTASTLGNAAAAAKVASQYAGYIDPTTAAVSGAKALVGKTAPALAKGVSALGAGVGSTTTGAKSEALMRAAEAGATSNPVLRKAFRDQMTGASNISDVADSIQNQLQDLKNERSAAIQTDLQSMSAQGKKIDWSKVNDAIDFTRKTMNYQNPVNGSIISTSTGGNAALDASENAVKEFSGDNSLAGFDAFKRKIDDLRTNTPKDPQAVRAFTAVRDGALAAINDVHPEYANTMKAYGDMSDSINSIQQAFKMGGRNFNAEKQLKAILATKPGSDKATLLDQLAQRDPRIPYMLAGHELQNMRPGGLRGTLMGPLAISNPGAAAGAMLVSSPRLAGSAALNAGRVARGVRVAGNAVNAVPTIGATTAVRAAGQNIDDTSPEPNAPPTLGAPGAESSPQVNGDHGDSQYKTLDQILAEPEGSPADAPTGTPDVEALKQQLAAQESGGHKDPYTVVGPHSSSGDKPYGKYQVMGHNIPIWTKEVLGRAMTPEEFMASPEAQEAVASAKLSDYLAKTGNVRDAAAMWHSGKTYDVAKARNRRDVLGTHTTDYADRAAESMGLFKGGRVGRAEGGKVDGDAVERLSNLLMTRVHAAKKIENKRTEPLLNQPDEHIVRALNVAQRAI